MFELEPEDRRMCMGRDWADARDGLGRGDSKNRRSEVRLEGSCRTKGSSPAWAMMFVQGGGKGWT